MQGKIKQISLQNFAILVYLGREVLINIDIIPYSGSLVIGELIAIKEGIKIVQNKDFQKVIMYSNSFFAVQVVTALVDDPIYVGLCALDIQSLSSKLDIISISHVKRTLLHAFEKTSSQIICIHDKFDLKNET